MKGFWGSDKTPEGEEWCVIPLVYFFQSSFGLLVYCPCGQVIYLAYLCPLPSIEKSWCQALSLRIRIQFELGYYMAPKSGIQTN